MQNVVIFCGSSCGLPLPNEATERTVKVAKELVHLLVRRDVGIIYGAGNCGLMGIIADTTLALNGRVTGVIPENLRWDDYTHNGLTTLHREPNMHSRKSRMYECADAAIALPGGYGTLEEIFEFVCWTQIGLHAKPLVC